MKYWGFKSASGSSLHIIFREGILISIGVDLGQRRDPSAIAVIDRVDWVAGRFHQGVLTERPVQGALIVRHLERVKLGTPYAQVVERLVAVARHPCLANAKRRMTVDATGVGLPVVEMLRAARPGCDVTAVVITGGNRVRHDGGFEMVPRVELLAGLQANLENGHLRIARALAEAPRLIREMTGLGTEEHDDLVMAVALAAWGAKTGTAFGFRREPFPVY